MAPLSSWAAVGVTWDGTTPLFKGKEGGGALECVAGLKQKGVVMGGMNGVCNV